MARIDSLSAKNMQTQGARQREWLRQYAPEHLEQCTSLMMHALQQRAPEAAQHTVILGAGACTEVPLAKLVRVSDELVLIDLDLAAMQQAYAEVPSAALRKRIRLVQEDISGGVSPQLARLMRRHDWRALASQGAQTLFDAVAQCLEDCRIPDPPAIQTLHEGESGLVISSLVLSQLFSYPLLDVLDHIQQLAPSLLGEQERHRRYQEAAQAFRIRLIKAHLHLLRSLLDHGGRVVLLTDVRGFVFNVHGTDHDA